MEDLRKTRDDLIEQMEELRQQLANLEIEIFDGTLDLGAILNPSDRSEERGRLSAKVQASPIFESITAEGINRSQDGICVQANEPFRFRLLISDGDTDDGVATEREGELIWFNHDAGRPSRFGFKFVD